MRRLLLALTMMVTLILCATAGAATVYVAPGGSGTSCTQMTPCGSFQAGYSRAVPGDRVELAGGIYSSSQSVSGDKATATSRITVEAAVGALVSVSGSVSVAADNVTLRGVRTSNGVDVSVNDSPSPNYIVGVRLEGVSGPDTYIQGTRDLVVKDSDFGPVSTGAQTAQIGGAPESTNLTFDHVRFHDNPPVNSTQHSECIFATGVQGLTIRNSTFDHCAYFGLLIGFCCGATHQPRDIVLDGNTFGATYRWDNGPKLTAPYSLMIGNVTVGGKSRFVNNAFATTPSADVPFADLTTCGNTGAAPAAWKTACPASDPVPTPAPAPDPAPTDLQAQVDKLTADLAAANGTIADLTAALAATRTDLATVTASRDAWKARADKAEDQVARIKTIVGE